MPERAIGDDTLTCMQRGCVLGSALLLTSLFAWPRWVKPFWIVLLLVALAGMTMVPKETWWGDAMLSAPLETAVLAVKPWMPQEVAKRIRFR